MRAVWVNRFARLALGGAEPAITVSDLTPIPGWLKGEDGRKQR